MLRPVVVDGLPVLLRHHRMDRLQRGDRHAADLRLERPRRRRSRPRVAPVVGSAGLDPAARGGARLVETAGSSSASSCSMDACDLRRREALRSGRTTARSRDAGGTAGFSPARSPYRAGCVRVRAVARIGLEELVPEEDAVLVAQFVKILARALADPVADHVHSWLSGACGSAPPGAPGGFASSLRPCPSPRPCQ